MRDPLPVIIGLILKISCPLFFRKIGKRTSFYGRVRIPSIWRDVCIGDECMIGEGVFFGTGKNSRIKIGDKCSLNTGVHVVASQSISIGSNVAIGEYVSIRDQEHRFAPTEGVRGQGYVIDPIVIASNVWIGRGAYIGPGVTISEGTIIGANSVVRAGVYPPNVLIAGTPASVKKRLA